MNICLVNMPYAQVMQPSLALGLLQAILQRGGYKVETVYANLHFLQKIGFRRFMWIMKAKAADGLRDWTFSGSAFPDFKGNNEEYLRKVKDANRSYDGYAFSVFLDILCEVKEIADLFTEHTARCIVAEKPRIVGCTTSLTQHVSALALLRKIRELDPEIVTLLGGANCEGIMGLTTHNFFHWVDYVVSGDADGLIVPLVQKIFQHGREIDSADLPPGVFGPAHRNNSDPLSSSAVNGQLVCNTFRDLENLPVPDYGQYFAALEAAPSWMNELIRPSIPIETSRGCWWREKTAGGCTFCSHSGCGTLYLSKTPDRVLDELDTLSRRYGISRIQPIDNVMNPTYFRSLLPRLARRRTPLQLFYEVRPTVARQDVEQMHRAGLHWVWSGLESLDSRLLKIMNKGTQAWQNIQFLSWCLEFGIYVGWNIIYDFPGEEDQWYTKMARLLPSLFHLQPPSGCVQLRYDRNSHYFHHQKRYGLKLGPPELYSYVYPLDRDDLMNQMYYLEDETRKWEDLFYAPLHHRPGLTSLVRTVADWQKRFHSRHRPVLTMIRHHDTVHIQDTRPIASQRQTILTEIEADVLTICRIAPGESAIAAGLAEHGMDNVTGYDVLSSLIEQKFVLPVDGRYVALPLQEPEATLPESRDYPGGEMIPRQSRN